MKVNVIVSQEYEIEINDKFNIMDLSECDDRWDEISTDLVRELVSTVQKILKEGIYSPLDIPEVIEIYNPEGEVLYLQGDCNLID